MCLMNEDTFYKEWGKEIAALRERAGMKKKELAEKIGVTPSMISDFENGGKKLSAWRINQCLEVFGKALQPGKKKPLLQSVT